MSRLKDLLKNEYVKSLILLAIILGGVIAFWFGLRIYLGTNYPLLAVASESMVPTLNKGDLIVVQGGLNISEVAAEYGTGDVIVFHRPRSQDELIVHRAVEMHADGAAVYLTTKGDNNNGPDGWRVYDDDLVGKVVWSIPYIGHVPLFVHTTTGMTIIIILIVILILLEFVIPSAKESKEPTQPEKESDVLDVGFL